MTKQVFKKRGGGNNTEESTFEISEETTEVPEIDGIMQQIDKSLMESDDIKVQEVKIEDPQKVRRGCCWSD